MTAVLPPSVGGSIGGRASLIACPAQIDLTEAIKDSPAFRHSLHEHSVYFQRLEARLNEILKYVTAMVDYGKNYVTTFYKLSVSVNQLCDESFAGNPLAESTFHSISDAYAHTVHLTKGYHEQSNLQVYNKLQSYIKNELAKVAEARAHFEAMSQSLDEALQRNAAGSRSRPADATDGRNALTAVGACFAHTSLDYVAQINVAHAHKDHLVLDALWSFVKESSAFFSKGHAFFDEWTAMENGAIADSVAALAAKSKIVERKMQDIHTIVPKEIFQHPAGMPTEEDVTMEGYLYKRSSNAFKTWNRRWFQIKDSKLLYSHRSSDHEEPTVMEDNLMLCLVRPAPPTVDRVGCFELVTPTRSHLLQADSESLCNVWMRALQRTILSLHEADQPASCSTGKATPSCSTVSSASSSPDGKKDEGSAVNGVSTGARNGDDKAGTAYEQIRKVPGNDRCADCGCTDAKWASINLGVVICIECSGIHRSLGVQTSKVRSLVMDSIDAGLRDVLCALGNERVNGVFLRHLPARDVVPPMAYPDSARPVREAWIKAKYVERRFARAAEGRARAMEGRRKESVLINKKSITKEHRSASFGDVEGLEAEKEKADREREQPHDDRAGEISRIASCGSDGNVNDLDDVGDSPPLCASFSAASSGDVLSLLSALAGGVDVNGVGGVADGAGGEGRSLLHLAVEKGQAAAVEFLLLNGAKINVLDERRNTPLHLAAHMGNTLQVCQLLKRGAEKAGSNADGLTPLEMAVEGKHADIVTLFRVHTMRDEFNEEFNNPMDETVDSVISDITRRAAVSKGGSQ